MNESETVRAVPSPSGEYVRLLISKSHPYRWPMTILLEGSVAYDLQCFVRLRITSTPNSAAVGNVAYPAMNTMGEISRYWFSNAYRCEACRTTFVVSSIEDLRHDCSGVAGSVCKDQGE